MPSLTSRARACGRPTLMVIMAGFLLGTAVHAYFADAPRDAQAGATPPAARTVEFVCDGGQRLSVTFEGNVARLVDQTGRRATLEQKPAASGIHYESAGESLRGKGQEITWSRTGAAPLVCRSGAGGPATGMPAPPAIPGLTSTRWQLIHFQSSDDAIGTIKPGDPTRFTLELMADGRLAMRLDCNRATGKWSASPASATGGSLSLGPLGVTRAACPDPMSDRLARDSGRVRSYTLKDNTLNLALEADGGVYSWQRLEK